MSSSTIPSRLAQAKAPGRVQVVAMDEFKFAAFSEKSAIGTRDLADCKISRQKLDLIGLQFSIKAQSSAHIQLDR